jgi:hypothetical protein
MVRDRSSGKDDTFSAETDGRGADGDDQFAHHVSSQLTQELARLLAASIAQSQAARGHAGGVPTGSDLTTLASLVSAATEQRTLAPVFKDGLSGLAYGPPQGRPAPSLDTPAHDPHHDDEPMPIPSTWRQPASYDDDRWFRQQLGATLLGLFAGLLIVVPAVLWLSGWIGPPRAKPAAGQQTASAPADTRPAEAKPPKTQARSSEPSASQYVTGSIEPRAGVDVPKPEQKVAVPVPVPVPAPAPPPKVDDTRARMEELIAQAMRRVETGDVTGAREILGAAEGGGQGPISFALAETYDPNKLAAWGTRGVAADAVKARALYTKALSLGMTRAQERLDALK